MAAPRSMLPAFRHQQPGNTHLVGMAAPSHRADISIRLKRGFKPTASSDVLNVFELDDGKDQLFIGVMVTLSGAVHSMKEQLELHEQDRVVEQRLFALPSALESIEGDAPAYLEPAEQRLADGPYEPRIREGVEIGEVGGA